VSLPDEAVIDQENKIATTPAYMYDEAHLKDMRIGISKVVQSILEM
jgi:enhancing lycopene biosynthesis protein 2